MKWSDALDQVKDKLQHGVQQVDDYWDSHGIAADAREQVDKHIPEALKAAALDAIGFVDRMLNALANDPAVDDSDTVPDEPVSTIS